jgi:hypothetical protein
MLATALMTGFGAATGQLWATLLAVPISGAVISISLDTVSSTRLISNFQQTHVSSKLLPSGCKRWTPIFSTPG